MPGKFIAFEGPDGAGKTTQMKKAGERLTARGFDVVYTREPGGTSISEKIRQILLDPANREMVDKTEALLYAAARAQHVEELIRPAVGAGKVVLCDRFTDSTLAYQGFGRGIDRDLLRLVNDMAVGGMFPSLTIILDIEPGTGLSRISETRLGEQGQPGKDRLEMESIEFHRRVRDGFLTLAGEHPGRYRVLAADREPAVVADEVWRCIQEVFGIEDS